MKQLISLIFISILSGCGGGSSSDTSANTTPKVEFPSYKNYTCTKQDEPESVVFCIDSDDNYESIGLEPSESDITLLNKILTVFPRRMRERVVEIEFQAKDIADGSAAVMPLDSKEVFWGMWVNTAEGVSNEDDPLESTIAHELEHYLTLNSTQLSEDKSLCGEMIATLETCPKKESIYFDYIQKFWVSIYDQDIWTSDDAYNDYYDAHQDDFVTPYAVTSPAEDIAETFSEFIFTDEPKNLSKIKDKKVKYFWNFKELVTLRSEIRKNLK